MSQPAKIVVFGASSSTQSINKTLAIHAAERLKTYNADVDIRVLDLNDFEMCKLEITEASARGVCHRKKILKIF